MKKKTKAFTLIELLVVIAIIAVLAAILLPTLNVARLRTYDTDCQNNLKNIGVALFRYADMHQDFLPGTSDGTPNGVQTNLVIGLEEFLPTNSPAWFCKRYLKDGNLDYEEEKVAGKIGYMYWAYLEGPNNFYPMSTDSTNSAWDVANLNTNVSGYVLLSDHFTATSIGDPADMQLHGGKNTELPGEAVGTIVLVSDGGVSKIAPLP